ncbi:MAG: hypothetical protein A2X64_07505 [Ignavibacteria bacterium GWF2_33_9]|nr:MAG: hypothetical protein A2X64_07505 [Ignavibacteria bacterium GWF2_33_9]
MEQVLLKYINISAPGLSKMRLVLDENGNWKKEFLVKDQVGTTKALIENIDGMPQVTNRYIFGPYGEPLNFSNDAERQGFIGKEKDLESGLADHGVRKYDYVSGRFISVDPLSEKFYGLTPYQYAANNPVGLLDENGKDIEFAEGTTSIQIEQYDLAVNYLSYFGLDREIKAVEVSPVKVILKTATTIPSFAFDEIGLQTTDQPFPTIWWCPVGGYQTADGNIQSPANGLYHEFNHALRFINDNSGYQQDMNNPIPYPNVEENRVLQKETEASEKLKEGVRKEYQDGGKFVPVKGPNSTEIDKNNSQYRGN